MMTKIYPRTGDKQTVYLNDHKLRLAIILFTMIL